MGVAIWAISGFRDSTIRTIVTQYLFSQGQANFPFDGNIGCIFSGLGLLCFGVLETRTRHSRSWIFMCCKADATGRGWGWGFASVPHS